MQICDLSFARAIQTTTVLQGTPSLRREDLWIVDSCITPLWMSLRRKIDCSTVTDVWWDGERGSGALIGREARLRTPPSRDSGTGGEAAEGGPVDGLLGVRWDTVGDGGGGMYRLYRLYDVRWRGSDVS